MHPFIIRSGYLLILISGIFFCARLHAQAPAPIQTELAALLTPAQPAAPAQDQPATAARDLFVVAGKSVVVQTPIIIERVVVTDPAVAEALAVTPQEIVVHGRGVGQTSLIIWLQGGNRLLFDLTVRPNLARQEALQEATLSTVEREFSELLGGQPISVRVEEDTIFLSGTVENLTVADRAEAIASTRGNVVNLLNVRTPPVDAQILLKVKFASVDRAAISQLGVNLFSTGALNTPGRITTGQFGPPAVNIDGDSAAFTLTDALEIFLVRPDLNLGASIRALQSRRLLEILAEPNVLAIDGKPASFLAGGEFPFPTLQGGGGGLGAVTIQFREFGVRINVTPTVTPRGTIRLEVTPEVSALDFANGLTFQGFTIPGLNTRRVQTEIELESGQSFAIGGLLDNRLTEVFNKIPGLGDIPILGKLFQSKDFQRNKSELLVLVTPELVQPIPDRQPRPEIAMPLPFLEEGASVPPRTPGIETTGRVPVRPVQETIPVERMRAMRKEQQVQPAQATGPIQFIPAQLAPVPAMQQPQAPPQQPQAAPPPAPGGAAR